MADTISQIVKANLSDGSSFAVEVTPIGTTAIEQRVSNVPHSFEDMLQSLEALSKAVYQAVKAVAPKKATVEFGVEIAAESGKLTALLVKGEGKANLKITLEWS